MNFTEKLIARLTATDSPLCVGLDSRYDRLPSSIIGEQSVSEAIFAFNRAIIESTHDLAAAFKMNVAFYAGFGTEGLLGLKKTNEFLRENFGDIPIIADCKRSEMGDSVTMVKQEIFDELLFTAIMVTPWFGFDTVKDYIADAARGVFVYIHDSNPSAPEFQGVTIKIPPGEAIQGFEGKTEAPLYAYVAHRVATYWNQNHNVLPEVGLTYPDAVRRTREIVGEETPILVAGFGPQGGKLESLTGLLGKDRKRILVNASRGVIFADSGVQFDKAARKAASDIVRVARNLQ